MEADKANFPSSALATTYSLSAPPGKQICEKLSFANCWKLKAIPSR